PDHDEDRDHCVDDLHGGAVADLLGELVAPLPIADDRPEDEYPHDDAHGHGREEGPLPHVERGMTLVRRALEATEGRDGAGGAGKGDEDQPDDHPEDSSRTGAVATRPAELAVHAGQSSGTCRRNRKPEGPHFTAGHSPSSPGSCGDRRTAQPRSCRRTRKAAVKPGTRNASTAKTP